MLSRVSSCGELPDSYQLNRPELATRGLVFGRNTDSDTVLHADALPLLISRKHAEVSVAGQTLCIIDAGSTNGTYVNEQRLRPAESKHLTNGDVISFGGPKLILRDGQQHSNPFVYVVSAVESLTGQAQQRLLGNRDSAEPAAGPATVVNYPQPSSAAEQLVDLTRTSSDEAGPSHIVDLTSSPDVHVSSLSKLPGVHVLLLKVSVQSSVC
jgi:pSer/pThr/pTyr-binding forkhead associated (FHA) protein